MSFLGKFLIFAWTLFSFAMLSWALALYTNRIDWTKTAAKEGKPEGVLVARAKRVEEGWARLDASEKRWTAERTRLLAVEKRTVADRAWYSQQLKAARGAPGNKDATILAVQLVEGKPVLNQQGGLMTEPAKDRSGQPLFTNQAYLDRLTDVSNQIEEQQKKYVAAVKEEVELTQLASGPKPVEDKNIRNVVAPKYDLKPGDLPLRQRIIDEQAKNAQAADELSDLKGRRTNSLVETELLLERRAQLEARIEELKKSKAGQ